MPEYPDGLLELLDLERLLQDGDRTPVENPVEHLAVRIASNNTGSLYNVAFKRPDGKVVLIVENDGNSIQTFNIKYNGKWVTASLDGGAVGTFVW